MKIVVASLNPVKLKAVDKAFELVFATREISITSVDVDSKVGAQPMTDKQTYQGALNRAKAAKKQLPEADYWLGLEGGVDQFNEDYYTFAWVVVLDRQHNLGSSRTATVRLPMTVVDQLTKGQELGHAMDSYANKTNTKQKQGAVGILTDGLISREQLYRPAVVLAVKALSY